MINYTNIISYPRSGQALIERIFNFYATKHNIFYKYCEFYRCCKTIPCIHGANFQKNHDLSLELKLRQDTRYIVLYRSDKIEQLSSFLRWNFKKKLKHNIDKRRADQFLLDANIYYEGFINKWVANSTRENIKVFDYLDICKNPYILLNAMSYAFDGCECGGYRTALKEFLKKEKIHRIIKLDEFYNYTLGYVSELV